MVGSVGGLRVLQRIFWLLEMDWEVRIYHSYCEAGKCVDSIENLGCHGGDSLIIHE